MKYKVIELDHKTEYVFSLKVQRPNCEIMPGQCFNVGIPGMGINREYSIYSNPDEPYLEFLIRKVNCGIVSLALSKLKVNDELEIDGPYGEFRISPLNLLKEVYFIATGTGIAPFHSFVKTYQELNYKLIHGIRYPNEQYDLNDYKRECYVPCISSSSDVKTKRVTDYLKNNKIPLNSQVYICGNRNMIVEVVEELLNQGLNGSQIITEVFF